MADVPRLVLTKQFTYEGVGKLWTNGYYFLGTEPTSFSDWSSFANDVIDLEKLVLQNDVTIVKAQGYQAGDDFPSYSENFTTVGTLSVSGASNAPRDCAAVVRFNTEARSTNNHPIYGYNYYHGVADYDSGSGHPPGWLYEPQAIALETYAQAWIDGIGDHNRCTAGGHACVAVFVDPWIRHRDFPR